MYVSLACKGVFKTADFFYVTGISSLISIVALAWRQAGALRSSVVLLLSFSLQVHRQNYFGK
jgi:hypothetical protein